MAVSYMTKDGYDKILAEINYLETEIGRASCRERV